MLVSGGSAANLTALACAREALLGPMTDTARAYVSDQAHSSVARAARAARLPARPGPRVPDRGCPAPAAGRARGALSTPTSRRGASRCWCRRSAGTTNTGTIDPLREIAEVCRERGVWLHVDGAYGAFAALTERGPRRAGGHRAGGLGHAGPAQVALPAVRVRGVLVRDGGMLDAAFEIAPDYLKDAAVARRAR